MYVPEEAVEAADMLPFNLPGIDQLLTKVYAHFYSYNCHPAMSNMDQAIKGDFDFLDGVIFAQICEETKRFGTSWPVHDPDRWFYSLMYPLRWDTPLAKDYLITELKRFRRSMADFAGREITDDALRAAIRLHNRVRAALTELYDLRRERPGLFPMVETEIAVNSALVMPKADYYELLSRYLDLKKGLEAQDDHRAKVVLVGNPCEDLEPGLARILDRLGVAVVDDELAWGGRYFASPVPEEGDPIEALAEAQWNMPYCALRERIPFARDFRGRTWTEYVLELVRRSNADGVVALIPKWCEIYPYDYVELRQRLEEAGTPVLRLEVDHSGAAGRVETRMEAFVEILEKEAV
jgi:benzoyl-CoA reductase/2-hydroxyglutaryl-CoA dehydratase subunit BcrC/BadD/HgdB